MAVSILSPDPSTVIFNAGTPGSTYSPVSGASAIIVPLNYGEFNGSALSALTLSAIGFTRLVAVTEGGGSNGAFSEIWWMPSGTIPGGSGLTLAITLPGSTWQDLSCTLNSVSGSVTPTVTGTSHNSTGANPSVTLACNIGDLIIASACSDRPGTAFGAWGNSFTSDQEGASPNSFYRSAIGHKIATSTTETATIVNNAGTSHSCTLAAAVIPQAGGAGGAVVAWIV